MINYQIFGLCTLLRQLALDEQEMTTRVSIHDLMSSTPPPQPGNFGALAAVTVPVTTFKMPYYVSDDEKKHIGSWIEYAKTICQGLFLGAALHRVALFTQKLAASPMTGMDYVAEVRALREAIEGDIAYIYFYFYQPAQAAPVLSFETDWAKALEKFPSIREDAFSAVDCLSLGHCTASVFHSMRIAEIGLRALARERRVKIKNKPLEWANWQDILTELGKKIDKIAGRHAGPTKDRALAFYQGALGEFGAFKDTYRNVVMHVRKTYDPHEAASALLHVREFMARLSTKLGEKDTRAIRWGRF